MTLQRFTISTRPSRDAARILADGATLAVERSSDCVVISIRNNGIEFGSPIDMGVAAMRGAISFAPDGHHKLRSRWCQSRRNS